MKATQSFRSTLLVAAILGIALLGASCSQQKSAVISDSKEAGKVEAAPSGANLAIIAEASSSRVFGFGPPDFSALNDGYEPKDSKGDERGGYGFWNWSRRRGGGTPTELGTQWVQYEWSSPICTKKIDVYWWDDDHRLKVPKASRLLHWNGKKFVPVKSPKGLGTVYDQYNTTSFKEVKTTKLRLEIDVDGTFSAGILEWKVYDSGKSPDFPPLVKADGDRLVVVGGRTYLSGGVRTIDREGGPATVLTWSKESGPGDVKFEDAGKADTTATFSARGDYVVKLTASKGTMASSATMRAKVVEAPPRTHLEPVLTKKYSISSRLWKNRAKALIVNWVPHCMNKISDPELREGGISNFAEAGNKLAGRPSKGHVGAVFSNGWVVNILESMCVAMMIDPEGDEEIKKAQEAIKATIEDWIPKIISAQEPDGYLQTAFTLRDPNEWQERWSPKQRANHEGYIAGYFIEAGIAHHIMTNGADTRMYDAVKKLADCWYDNIGPAPKKEWFDGHQEMEQALVRLGRYVNQVEGAGKGDKYVELAKFLLDCRKDGSEYDQSHVPVVRQYEAVGHAVRAVYSYAGMADVAMETGDGDYLSAVESLWDSIVNKKYYVTGGVGSGESSEGFGPDYSLRNNSYCESCSGCGELFFQHKMNMIYKDAKYADLYEETLYNAILGDIDLAGKNFYYQNSLDSGGPRYDWHGCPCCVGNIPRTLLMLPTWMYLKSNNGIYVNLFIGSTVTVEDVAGTNVTMIQDTDYPWSGNVSITVNPDVEKEFSVRIRRPRRQVSNLYTSVPDADGIVSIAVNGSQITPEIRRGYAVIRRTWKAGDKIDVVLPMKVQRITGIDKIEATKDKTALRYGPLVYNVERVDQDITKVIAPDTELTTEWMEDLLEGVLVVKGAWADGSPLIAIPNYARNNRGQGASEEEEPAGEGEGNNDFGRRFRRPTSSIVWIKNK